MTGLVSLPMYDWPEVSDALDRLWGSIRQSLDELGVDAPVERARPDESITHWRNPSLLLSQTCGLPLRRYLLDAVTVIGNRDQDHSRPHMKAVRIVIDGRNYDMYPERIRSD